MNDTIEILKYSNEYEKEWDSFIEGAKNSHFIFYRRYMEYHSDRFIDHSIMFYLNKKLICIMPANITNDNILLSHGGLTFGGIISDFKMSVPLMKNVFDKLIQYLKDNNIKELLYKCIPYIYHTVPAQEDCYVLFSKEAQLIRRDVTTTIYGDHKLKFQERRSRSIKKALKTGGTVSLSNKYGEFWKILTENLSTRYNVNPVHNIDEIKYLQNQFPDHIKLFVYELENEITAGVVVFENNHIAHAQYIASNEMGKNIGALDAVFNYLINDYYNNIKYFDFGISEDPIKKTLNTGLIEQKEGFGGRAVTHDFYRLTL